ncbi:MAG: nickel-responsive transcriptional regulator NikR [Candidatus Bathyarchaeia archaeon]
MNEEQSTIGVIRFSVSLPPKLVKEFDEVWKEKGYDNRSRATHDAFRNFISEHKWAFSLTEEVAGVIVIVYYLDKPSLLNRIVEVQHSFECIISSTMHIHLTRNKCLEIIAVKGKAKDVRELSEKLSTLKGVKETKIAITIP